MLTNMIEIIANSKNKLKLQLHCQIAQTLNNVELIPGFVIVGRQKNWAQELNCIIKKN